MNSEIGRGVRRWIVGFGTLMLFGCGHKDPTVPAPFTGEGLVYQLIRHQDAPLPAITALEPFRIELLAGALTLSSDSTWIMSIVERHTRASSQFVTETRSRGSYSRSGSSLLMPVAGLQSSTYVGTWTTSDVRIADGTASAPTLTFHRE